MIRRQNLDLTIKITGSAKGRTVLEVIEKLSRAGYQAVLAGGSVRDLLLGRKPKDFDIATDARPEQIEAIFPKTIPVGREFGIVIVRHGRWNFEVATFRGERGYTDRRRPSAVYWADAATDAARRDFTINALFWDPKGSRLVDFVDGERDLGARLVRFVGDPTQRVAEDYLRILRAIRLKNSLNFQYDPAAYQAIRANAHDINQISPERIRDELNLMWADASRAAALHELADVGLLAPVLPEIDRLRGLPQPVEFHREGDTFDHTLQSLAALPARVPSFLVWAVLLHDAGKAETLHYPESATDRIRFEGHARAGSQLARQVGVRLRMPRVEIETIAWLIDHHMNLKNIEAMRPAKQRAYLLDPRFRWLLELHRADAAGTLPRDLTLYRETKRLYREYLARWRAEQKIGAPKPLVTGHDLQAELGMAPGPKLGRILEKIKEAQLERRIISRREAFILARSLLLSE